MVLVKDKFNLPDLYLSVYRNQNNSIDTGIRKEVSYKLVVGLYNIIWKEVRTIVTVPIYHQICGDLNETNYMSSYK